MGNAEPINQPFLSFRAWWLQIAVTPVHITPCWANISPPFGQINETWEALPLYTSAPYPTYAVKIRDQVFHLVSHWSYRVTALPLNSGSLLIILCRGGSRPKCCCSAQLRAQSPSRKSHNHDQAWRTPRIWVFFVVFHYVLNSHSINPISSITWPLINQ